MPISEGFYANSSGYVVNIPNTILSSGSISVSSANTITSAPSFYTSAITPASFFPPNQKHSITLDVLTRGITSPLSAIIAFFYDLCGVEQNRILTKHDLRPVDQHVASVLFYLFENQNTIFEKYKKQNTITQINDAYEKDDFSGLFPDLRKDCERIYELSRRY